MNGIIELENTIHENAYIGYKRNMLKFLKQQLKEYVETIPSAESFDYDYLLAIKACSDQIINIEEHADNDNLLMVYDVLFETMGISYAQIVEC